MTRFILLFVIALVNSETSNPSLMCNEFQANFDIKDVIGPWKVVAIIPVDSYPESRVKCQSFKVEFSDVDGAGLKWLLNKTVESQTVQLLDTSGTIVRQRYHTDKPFDVWSKAVNGVNGCFQQVIALDWSGENQIDKQRYGMMQLHLFQVQGSEPFLLQILWGNMAAVAIYRRNEGVTLEELKPVVKLMEKIRKTQRPPKICDSLLKDILMF